MHNRDISLVKLTKVTIRDLSYIAVRLNNIGKICIFYILKEPFCILLYIYIVYQLKLWKKKSSLCMESTFFCPLRIQFNGSISIKQAQI